jgi:hypothetical protein
VNGPSVEELIRRSRIERRRAHRIAAFRRWTPRFVLVGGAVGVAVWSVLAGPLHQAVRSNAGVAASVTTTPATSSGSASAVTSTSETLATLALRSYNVGDCVTWPVDRGDQVDTKVVPCSAPHFMEVTGHALMPDQGGYPSDAAWAAFSATGACASEGRQYLRTFDPHGRFGIGFIRPLPDAWSQGDREVWCSFDLKSPTAAEVAFTGRLQDLDQSFVFPVGTCMTITDTTIVLPCTSSHESEVVGIIDLSTYPADPTPAQWNDISFASLCRQAAGAYLGRPLTETRALSTWAPPIQVDSWSVGTRKTNCLLTHYGLDGKPIPTIGSAKGT